jgi:tryptophan-rich hypothetical protein|tara:strand:- start:526 stop:762 length:237 start_codon:yes stop_codon:yes gene_type:complete
MHLSAVTAAQINPKKLNNSKWTRVNPVKKQKHFIVVKVVFADDGAVEVCVIEAVIDKVQYSIDWKDLQEKNVWLQGWL